MRLDIVIATFRRPELLRKTLLSILDAERPTGLALQLIVVDNDSPVSDLASIADLRATAPFPIHLLHEPRPGKSNALNTAVAMSTADYVGFIDDDEEIDRSWLRLAYEALSSGELDFVGGRNEPVWHVEPPAWLPRDYPAIVGIVDNGPEPQAYGEHFPGLLVGGNAVIARRALDRVGPFSPALGPRDGNRLLSCEDEDMYWRLIDAGARGRYLPGLVVHHHVPAERLTRSYHRRWAFWNGVSKAILGRRPASVRHVHGVPRYLYGEGLRSFMLLVVRTVLRSPPDRRFSSELAVWNLAGHLYGRYWFWNRLVKSRTAGAAAPGPAGPGGARTLRNVTPAWPQYRLRRQCV